MAQRQAQYKYTQCENCGKSIDVARLLDINFCDDKCRAEHHRKQQREMQVYRGAKILADWLKSTPVSIKRLLGEKAILAAMKENGLKWSQKDRNYKDRDGKLYGQMELDDTPEYLRDVLSSVSLTFEQFKHLDIIYHSFSGITTESEYLTSGILKELDDMRLITIGADKKVTLTQIGETKVNIVRNN